MTHRTITTVQELDALPEYAVVIDAEHDVSQKRGGAWCSYETVPMSGKALTKYGPVTVIWEPNR